MKLASLFAAVLLIATSASGQLGPGLAGGTDNLPRIDLNTTAANLQRSLYPDVYRNHSARTDLRWVERNDSAVVAFWQEYGNTVLYEMTKLAGFDWIETSFDCYLLRYYPTSGEGDPLILPVGGMRRGSLIEAAPSGSIMRLNIIFQLARRLLAQVDRANRGVMRQLAEHPLMQPTPTRRDNLAFLLALVTSQNVFGLDSTYAAYHSAFWQNRTPARELFEEHLLTEWILTPQRPLAQWVAEEPYGSKLVTATRLARRPRRTAGDQHVERLEGLPLRGRLGFTVAYDDAGRMFIDKIDVYRLAYASGLREGDIIREVEGVRIRNQKDLIEKILAGLDNGVATVEISREGRSDYVLIQPMMMPLMDEDLFLWDDEYPDSLPPDTVDDADTIGPTPY